MNIYRVYIWGPCDSEEDVQSRRAEGADNVAVVVAPSLDIANQVCYLVASGGKFGQSTYQEIEGFSANTQCIVESLNDPRVFDSEIIEDLIQHPKLPAIGHAEDDLDSGYLYSAKCISDAEIALGEFWAFSIDDTTANILVTEHGNQVGLFDLDTDSIKVELLKEDKVCVFWGGNIKLYSITKGI